MNTLDRIESVLQMRDCWYQHDTHPAAFTAREVALLDDVPQRSFAKTVVVHWEQGFSMAVLPADKRVDLEELRLDFGFHHLRLATEFELQELFPECEDLFEPLRVRAVLHSGAPRRSILSKNSSHANVILAPPGAVVRAYMALFLADRGTPIPPTIILSY